MEEGPLRTGELGIAGATRTGIAEPARVEKLFLRVPKKILEEGLSPEEVLGLFEGLGELAMDGRAGELELMVEGKFEFSTRERPGEDGGEISLPVPSTGGTAREDRL